MNTIISDKITFQNKLLDWYHANKRYMPWREDPTPYHVWISEIMLQQTRVEAVREYYARFISTLPDICSLSQVEDDVLHKLWEGLGYYNRAKNLKKAAIQVITDFGGELPNNYNELITLSGIGPYTAGAIASIAFHEAVPAVDGNVMRVIARITGDSSDITENSTKKQMTDLVQEIIPEAEVHHFNQALMELGALICLPNGEPKCSQCPMSTLCTAYQDNSQNLLPVKKKKKARTVEEKTILLLQDNDKKIYIQKRAEKGLLSGLWEFPSITPSISKEECEKLVSISKNSAVTIFPLPTSKHIFTHIEWHMNGFLIQLEEETPTDFLEKMLPNTSNGIWVKTKELQEVYPIPTAFKTYKKELQKQKARYQQMDLFSSRIK